MKHRHRLALIVAVSVLISLPLLFGTVSYLTGQWEFLLFSLPATLTAGLIALLTVGVEERREKSRA